MVLTHRDWNRVLLNVAALRASFADTDPVEGDTLKERERVIRGYAGLWEMNSADIREVGLRKWAPPQLDSIFGARSTGKGQDSTLSRVCQGIEESAAQIIKGQRVDSRFEQRKVIVGLDTLHLIAEHAYDFNQMERIRAGIELTQKPIISILFGDLNFFRGYSLEHLQTWAETLQTHYDNTRGHDLTSEREEQLPLLDNIAITRYLVDLYAPATEGKEIQGVLHVLYQTAFDFIIHGKGSITEVDYFSDEIDRNNLRGDLQKWYGQHVRAALDEYTLTILGDGRGELTSVVRGPPPVREDWLVDDYFGDPDPIKPGYDLTESTTEVDFADFEGMAPLNPDNSYEPFDGNGERDLPGETRAYPPGWLNGLDGEVEVIPSPSGDGIDAVIPSPKSVRRPNRRGCHPLLWFDTVLSHERLYISKWNEEKPTRTEWIKSAFRHPWKTSYTSFMVYVMGKEIKD